MDKSTIVAAALASLALGACSHLPAFEEWEAQPSHPPLPADFHVVDSKGIASNCGDAPGMYVHGCAQRDFARRTCMVFTRADPEGWLVAHEQKHCDGWDHVGLAPIFPGITSLAATPLSEPAHDHDTH